MNKRLLGLATTLLVAMMIAVPLVYAKPTEAANSNNFLSFVWHQQGTIPTTVVHVTDPPWATGTDILVVHDEVVWHLNPNYANYIKIGDDSPIPINTVTGFEGYMYVQSRIISPTYSTLNYRVYEKMMWGDNFIEIINLERGSKDTSSGKLVFDISGIFTGTGVIDGQKVQVTGVRELSGTLPGFVVECTGTIRFLGSAA